MAKNHFQVKTDFEGLQFVQASTDSEWQAVGQFRQKYFFDRVPISDPYTWTFKHPEHMHFVIYKDSKIIGYAHIQLWPEKRAALKIIVIDEAYRNRGIGSEFLKMCEQWLKARGIKTLHAQSTPEAYQFYRKLQYTDMPFNDPEGNETHPRDIEIGKNF